MTTPEQKALLEAKREGFRLALATLHELAEERIVELEAKVCFDAADRQFNQGQIEEARLWKNLSLAFPLGKYEELGLEENVN